MNNPPKKSVQLPYWNCRIDGDPKTFGEHAREGLIKWAKERAERDMNAPDPNCGRPSK